MGSYKYEKTYNYLNVNLNNRYITIRKYLIAKDETDQRYAVFELANNFKETVEKISIQVKQYDKDNNLINTTDIPYDGLKIRGHSKFVPFFKFAVDKKTEKITTALISADFENHLYRDGKLLKFDKPKTEKKEEEKKVKDTVNKQVNVLNSKHPKKCFLIMSIIVLAVMALFVGAFSLTNDSIVVNDIEFKTKTGEITGYYGSATNVVIPETIKNNEVKKIASKAFMNSNITSITIEAEDVDIDAQAFLNAQNLTRIDAKKVDNIGVSAFENCYSLTTVNIQEIGNIGNAAFKACRSLVIFRNDSVKSIGQYCFNDCTKLQVVDCPNARLSTMAFNLSPERTTKLASVTFGTVQNTANATLKALFSNVNTGFENVEITTNINYVNDYFIGDFKCSKINFTNPKVTYSDSFRAEYEAFAASKNQFIDNGYYKKIFDVIVDIYPNAYSNYVQINDVSIKGIRQDAINKIAMQTESLVLDCDMIVSKDLLQGFYNLKSLELGNNMIIEDGAFSSSLLQFISLPVSGSFFKDLFSYMPSTLQVNLIGNKAVPSRYFKDCNFVKTIDIDTTASIGKEVVINCSLLSELIIRDCVTKMEMPVIGRKCNSLSKVYVSYLGAVNNQVTYKEFNASYQNTKYLEIQYGSALEFPEGCFEGLSDVEIVINGGIKNSEKMFAGTRTIRTLEIGEASYDKSDKTSTTFNNLVISGGSVKENYFAGCKADNLVLYNKFGNLFVNSDAITSTSKITSIFFNGTVSSYDFEGSIKNNNSIKTVYSDSYLEQSLDDKTFYIIDMNEIYYNIYQYNR